MFHHKHQLSLPYSTNSTTNSHPPFLPQSRDAFIDVFKHLSYTMTMPYRPPDVQQYYASSQFSQNESESEIESKIYTPQERDFSYYETHYAEKPLSGLQPDALPTEMYGACAFEASCRTNSNGGDCDSPTDGRQADWLRTSIMATCEPCLGSECDRNCNTCRLAAQSSSPHTPHSTNPERSHARRDEAVRGHNHVSSDEPIRERGSSHVSSDKPDNERGSVPPPNDESINEVGSSHVSNADETEDIKVGPHDVPPLITRLSVCFRSPLRKTQYGKMATWLS